MRLKSIPLLFLLFLAGLHLPAQYFHQAPYRVILEGSVPAILALSIFLLFSGCNRDEVQARKSIEGDWEVTAINSVYGEFIQNGFSSDTTISETGQLGSFNFTDDVVTYTFTRNDTVYAGNGAWELVLEKVNSGFTRVNQSTLAIANDYEFDVQFEDGTKNSEKKAESATFTETPATGSGWGVIIQLSLAKQ